MNIVRIEIWNDGPVADRGFMDVSKDTLEKVIELLESDQHSKTTYGEELRKAPWGNGDFS